MRIHTFQWPDDLTSEELTWQGAIEAEARRIAKPYADTAHLELSRALIANLANHDLLSAPRALAARLRIVVAEEAEVHFGERRMGARVRFTWHAWEAQNRRDAKIRADGAALHEATRTASRSIAVMSSAMARIPMPGAEWRSERPLPRSRPGPTLVDVLGKTIVRLRADGEQIFARAGRVDELIELVASKQDGDRFYAFDGMWDPSKPIALAPELTFKDHPTELELLVRRGREYRAKRAGEAVDLLVRIVRVTVNAYVSAAMGAYVLDLIMRSILRAWAADPNLLEIEERPRVDSSSIENDTAERFALIELS